MDHVWIEKNNYKLTFYYIISECSICKLIKKEIFIDSCLNDTIFFLTEEVVEFLTCDESIIINVIK